MYMCIFMTFHSFLIFISLIGLTRSMHFSSHNFSWCIVTLKYQNEVTKKMLESPYSRGMIKKASLNLFSSDF